MNGSATTQPVKVSVVVVNYNVKEYLEQLLLSLQRALANFAHEIWVVDNNSVDGSVAHIRRRFPEVKLIENKQNLGFAKANNLALRQAKGDFIVIINPDTVVQEDTFEKLISFFNSHPDAGAATCKIINPDGSFSVDCRHSIPTPLIAFWKVVGLSKLFPQSRVFAKYNLTYLDPNQTYPVPAISGSFMMFRREVIDQVGLFDERFFMYCEDIDLCHRINLAGFKIYYVPTSQIIHYKGESTKKNNLDYVVTFNKALYKFFRKYYAQRSVFLFRWLITLGIILRGMFIYLRNFLHNHFPLLLDALILNIIIVVAFIIRYSIKDGFYWHDFFSLYWIINLISTVLFVGGGYYLEVYPLHKFSVHGIIKNTLITFILLASATFFLKQFAFSRSVVLVTAVISPLLMILWRVLLKRYYRGDKTAWGKDILSKPTIIVGNGKEAVTLYEKIRELRDVSYELIGVVTVGKNSEKLENRHIPVLGSMEYLGQLISMHRIRQVIFSSEILSYEQILKTMSNIDTGQVEYKIVPSNLEVVIGKSSIERLDDYPLLDVEYAIGKPFNRILKRLFDAVLSLALLLLTSPIMLPLLLMHRKSKAKIDIGGRKNTQLPITQIQSLSSKAFLNKFLLLWEILKGKLSFVGFPIDDFRKNSESNNFWYKPGISGLVQINRGRIIDPEDVEKYHLFYLKNQSLLLDAEILLKSLVKGKRKNKQ